MNQNKERNTDEISMNEMYPSRRDVLKGMAAIGFSVLAGSTFTGMQSSVQAEEMGKPGQVTMSDGVKLHYLEAGSGKPLLMIPGWSQSAEQFKYQLSGLKDRYRVIALDMRGHGESEKPNFGYKIARLSKDVYDVLQALDLRDVNILGHSMGCSVIWNYWELFGPERLSKLLLVDQMPFITSNPIWSQAELEAAGSIFNCESLYSTINALAGPEGVETTKKFVGGMVTKAMSEADLNWMIERNLRLPRQHAATLLYHHSTQDWRDLIPRINIPTLVVGGRTSVVPWKSQVWIHEQIPGSRLEIFEENEGGQHFMFIEGAEKFNRIVAEFIG
ncbi:MAG: alpha/beta hydrolase [Nitrospira sp.]|nr:alpha/beta hydrolase [Nitrospira sp.]